MREAQMPLEYSRPPSALALELEDVAKRSRELTEALRQINTPPDGFPKASVEEIANVLCALPSGTAEGCRTPLEYARLRLASIRREYMAKECADSLNPFARGSELDQKFANLYTAVGTALDEYRALAALPTEVPETPEPTVAAPENDRLAAQGLDIGEKTQQAYENGAKTIGDIARPESTRADDLKRQMEDAAGLTRLSRNELSLPGVVVGWYRRAIAKLAEYPRIIQKTVSGIRKATDIAEKCWDVWDRFQSKGVKLIFEVTREFLEIAQKFADDLEKGDCQEFCVWGHSDADGGRIWRSRRTPWTICWRGATLGRFSPRTACSTS
jgi:hypothetical protein